MPIEDAVPVPPQNFQPFHSEAAPELISGTQMGDLTRDMLSVRDILEDLEHDLRGEVYDEAERKWIASGEPLMNEKGIKTVISMVRSRMGRHGFLSNLSKLEVHRMTVEINFSLVQLLYLRSEDFEIMKENREIVLDSIMDMVFMSLKRAESAGERGFLKSMRKSTERIVVGGKDKGKIWGD